MENTKILIEVRGGIVQSVKSNRGNVKIVIVDYDNIQGDESCVSGINDPDIVIDNLYKSFKDPSEQEIREELERMNF